MSFAVGVDALHYRDDLLSMWFILMYFYFIIRFALERRKSEVGTVLWLATVPLRGESTITFLRFNARTSKGHCLKEVGYLVWTTIWRVQPNLAKGTLCDLNGLRTIRRNCRFLSVAPSLVCILFESDRNSVNEGAGLEKLTCVRKLTCI